MRLLTPWLAGVALLTACGDDSSSQPLPTGGPISGGDTGTTGDGPQSCGDDEDCNGRGEICDPVSMMCVPDVLPENTGDGLVNFPTMAIPTFRGLLCTTTEVQTNTHVPFTLSPCFHPCLNVGSFKYKYAFSCSTASGCNGWVYLWVRASGTDCPADVFGQFDESMCVYDQDRDFSIEDLADPDGPEGMAWMEVPYLSNADAAVIDASDAPVSEIKMRINNYPQDPGRVVGPILVAPEHPVPPGMCGGATRCECFEVGFQ